MDFRVQSGRFAFLLLPQVGQVSPRLSTCHITGNPDFCQQFRELPDPTLNVITMTIHLRDTVNLRFGLPKDRFAGRGSEILPSSGHSGSESPPPFPARDGSGCASGRKQNLRCPREIPKQLRAKPVRLP